MKKVFFIGTVLLCGMLIFSNNVEAQSRKDRKKIKKEAWELEQKRLELERQRMLDSLRGATTGTNTLPCGDAAKSDDDYFRLRYCVEDVDMSLVQQRVFWKAESDVIYQLGDIYKALVKKYSMRVSYDSNMEIILGETILNGMSLSLSDFDKVCEMYTQTLNGYCYHMAIEIPKKKIVDAMVNSISGNERVSSKVDIENFRNYAEEYLKNNVR